MDDGLYDFRKWPQAGRDQLEEALLKGKQMYLQKELIGFIPSTEKRRQMESALQEVQTRLGELTR